jgi:hypothetical protein
MNTIKRLPTVVVLGAMLVVAACGGSSGTLGSVPPIVATPSPSNASAEPDLTPGTSPSPTVQPSPGPSSSLAPTTSPSASPGETMIVRTYFILGGAPGSEGLVPTLAEVPKAAGVASAAMTALLAGVPSRDGYSTVSSAIPAGTTLLGLTIKNGIATVDLSTEFDSGGGSASQQYRLAQVVYTLTQFSTVKSVVFQIEGQTVTVFGSEGIKLDGPVGRTDFTAQLPSIFVDRPAFGAAIGNPGRVTGSADVFEATFRMSLLDASGKTLIDRQVMATCGSGCRGTFDVTLPYTVAKGQWGTLHVYNPSAKDGTPEDIRDYPVWLTPAG